jgi:sterol carrier protein 2
MVESKRKEERVFVIGNGMTKFLKPGKHEFDYHDLSEIAIKRALRDAGVQFKAI